MVKIVIDADDGLKPTGKRSPVDDREWGFNDKVVRATIEKLKTYQDVEILRVDDPTGKTEVSLKTRTDRATEWGTDVYVTIHHNALSRKWGEHSGIWTYTFQHPNTIQKSEEIPAEVHPRVIKAMGIRNQGVKHANYHVLRESTMPAILAEGGFMNSLVDIIKLRDVSYLKAEGVAIAEGLAAYIKLKPKSTATNELIETNIKENKLNKPSSEEVIEGAMIVIQHLESTREGVLPKEWVEKVNDGTLNESDAIGLLYVVIHRWLSD